VPTKLEVHSSTSPVPEIIGVAKTKFRESLTMPTLSVPSKNSIGLPYRLFLYQHSFAQSFRLEFRVEVAKPNLGEEEVVGDRGWCHSKERC